MNTAYVREALELARQGRGQTSPNPMVGALLVRDGQVVGRGVHTYADKKHAEIRALEQAGEQARGATLYINLEPCSHLGRTGPCAEAIVAAGVSEVIAAMQDPNPLVSGRGFGILRQAGVKVEIAAELTAQAEKLNEAFVHYMRAGRPLVTLKTALTLDGKIAAPDDNRGWITSEVARAHVQQLRHDADAILTGIGTVLADDCLLTDRMGLDRSRPFPGVPEQGRHESGRDRLPPDGLAFFAQQDQALLGIEVLRAQRQRAAPAAGGLGVQAQQQRVQLRVITYGHDNAFIHGSPPRLVLRDQPVGSSTVTGGLGADLSPLAV